MARFYGGDGTWHNTDTLDIETDVLGNVVAVWFRCQPLPFKQVREYGDRIKEMRQMYKDGPIPRIDGLSLVDGAGDIAGQ